MLNGGGNKNLISKKQIARVAQLFFAAHNLSRNSCIRFVTVILQHF